MTPSAVVDAIGMEADLTGVTCMARSAWARKWLPICVAAHLYGVAVDCGGVLLLPIVVVVGGSIPAPTHFNLMRFIWRGLVG
ncbi:MULTISPECIES: hypothetical protein [Brucella]|uniref:Uncharacterized protein n=2 Tax=Brucella TaxID=234 RepID=A0AB34DIV6_9HYPH|nr:MULTISPECIES: hypothetical protein [Brucella]KAB2701727.1 hypothetical protein F9L03_22070 [Brucella lupini]KAB2734583.1 hypothetical protein F9K90_15245 [Brucella anthropi]KAB2740681.1 hypothetical protein F9K89_04790 [Brucella anthropi]KAB2749587.1 hypothetical protein F9K95_16645 [Brucella anthropi]KAB2765620.1 hypothetical protein F9L04_18950 [Brucella anthropi]